jgi:sulfite reductase (ferredoxin)
LLGGGILGDGKGRFSDKVIKIPSRRGPDALRFILNDFEANGTDCHFWIIMTLKAKVFYEFLKPLADTTNLTDEDFIDWEMPIIM